MMAADPSAAAPEELRLPGRFWLYWTASCVSWAGDLLMTANSIIAYVVGPGLGGLLFSHGRHVPMLIDAASFALAAVLLAALRLSGHERELPPREKRHFVREVVDGLKLIAGKPA